MRAGQAEPPNAYDTTLSAVDRKRRGAWYTPPALVRHVVDQTLPAVVEGQIVRVLDPACGDGRFLFEAARVIRSRGGLPVLTGADIDLGGLINGPGQSEPIEAICTDSLRYDWRGSTFDVVLGNPPFLSQLAVGTVREGGSKFGGGPYADAAAEFLGLCVQLARSDGGRIGLVLPTSLLTARDAGPIRASVLKAGALRSFWWSADAVFDAAVRTCAVSVELGPDAGAVDVERFAGMEFTRTCAATPRAGAAVQDHWGWLISDSLGVVALPPLKTCGLLSQRALATANFRDQYYGLVGAVSDEADGPPLITTGLIDVARCHWGDRPVRFAKQQFFAPRVDRSVLAAFMQRWADRCLVPKVLLATQTRILEAVVDPLGEWLPAVPVIRLVPADGVDVWELAAVMTSPVASALIAHQSAGSGLSVSTMRVSQRTVGALEWPAGEIDLAVAALRAGDVMTCGRLIDAAYGVTDRELFEWWWTGVQHSTAG